MATKRYIYWVAHRGNCESHIENTLQSIQSAIQCGINHIEIDVQFTKEGFPIVFHDGNLKRLLNINKPVAHVSYEDIKALPLKNSNHQSNIAYNIPSLAQVVSLIKEYPNVTLYVEIKNINFIDNSYKNVFNIVNKCIAPIKKQAIIIGFSYRFLRVVRNNSTLPIAYVLPVWKNYSAKMLSKLTPEFIFADIDIIPSEEDFHSKKETWIVYETSRIEQVYKLMEQGIYGFESFTPNKLKKQFNKKPK